MARQAKKSAQSLAEVRHRADEEARALGLELTDVAIVRENTGSVLRFTIDKDAEGGVTLDDCENFHRRALKYAQDIDYDYMEVSSPGADRPLKRDRDFERALGQGVEARFYRQMDGLKQLTGRLIAFDADSVTLDICGQEKQIARNDIAQIRLTLDEEELDSPLFEELEQAAQEQPGQNTEDGGESQT